MGKDVYQQGWYPEPGKVYWKQNPYDQSLGWECVAGTGIEGDPYKDDTYVAKWKNGYAYDEDDNQIIINGKGVFNPNALYISEEEFNKRIEDVAGMSAGVKIANGAKNLVGLYGFRVGISADEVRAINNKFGGMTELNGRIDSILENAARYDGFWDKTAAITRSIVNNHTFDNGNKRTAFTVIQELMERNGISTGVSAEGIKNVIYRISTGELKDVTEIAKALRGF